MIAEPLRMWHIDDIIRTFQREYVVDDSLKKSDFDRGVAAEN
jgi:hypothetical protein